MNYISIGPKLNYDRRNRENPLGSFVKYTLITTAGFILGFFIGALGVAYIARPAEESKHEVKVREKPSKIEHYVAQKGTSSVKSQNTSTNVTEAAR